MSYYHLTIAEREDIRVFREQGMSQRWIARHLGRNPSTISREMTRNLTVDKTYRAHAAQERYQRVRQDMQAIKEGSSPGYLQ